MLMEEKINFDAQKNAKFRWLSVISYTHGFKTESVVQATLNL